MHHGHVSCELMNLTLISRVNLRNLGKILSGFSRVVHVHVAGCTVEQLQQLGCLVQKPEGKTNDLSIEDTKTV